MMLGKKISVKGLVILGDPTKTSRTLKIPEMDM
jgi:hypothetical protein